MSSVATPLWDDRRLGKRLSSIDPDSGLERSASVSGFMPAPWGQYLVRAGIKLRDCQGRER